MGGGNSVTIGYQYFMGMHMALCHGPVDVVYNIYVDDRLAWSGSSGAGTISINAPELFGGDKKEGGISGTVNLEFGEATQGINAYLLSKLGVDTPAFRGVMCAVLNQVYVGNNPYLKPWSFEVSRIHVLEDGSEQWYDEKADMPTPNQVEARGILDDWRTGEGADSALWIRNPVIGTLPESGVVGYGWDGFGRDSYPFIVDIGNRSQWSGTTTIPPLPGPVGLKIEFWHDDSLSGVSISGTGIRSYTLEEDSYFTTHADVVIEANEEPRDLYIAFSVTQGEPEGTTLDYGGGLTITLNTVSDAGVSLDMNPAHIIREALTESWGLGHPTSDIDNTAFTDAADTLYDENMGISILWDKEMPLEDFIAQILQHINAELYVSRTTGKFVLKLIRDDYTVGSLLVLDETNAQMAEKASRPSLGELVTSVTVQFTDRIAEYGDGSLTVHNEALIQMQQTDRNATVQYPGFCNRSTANRVALRDLKALSTPLLTVEMTANREAASLNIGDVFVLDFPEQGINSLVMRVQSMSVGDGLDNSVSIRAIEDVFSAPTVGTYVFDVPRWEDPLAAAVLPASPRVVIEAPYYELVRDQGQLAVDTALADDPDLGFIAATAGRQGTELNANLLVDSGAGYVDSDVLDFAPYATLAIDAWYSDANLYYTSGKDLDIPVAGALAQIGDEIIRFDSLGTDSNGTYFAVGRGVLDTTPAEHLAGVSIVFYDLASDDVRYTASESIDVKIQTTLGSSVSSGEPVDTVVMDSRAIRPYPPGDLVVDGLSYPLAGTYYDTTVLTWAHRDRLQQTSGTVFDYTDGDIGPEAGTQYIVRADAILLDTTISADFVEENVGGTAGYAHGVTSGTPPFDAEFIRWKVYSLRGGYESWQPAMAVVNYVPVDSNLVLWTPAYTTTDLWLDCNDAGNKITSGKMETLLDLSGKGQSATRATSTERPTFNSADLNGMDTITFDGSNDYLSYGSCNLMKNMASAMTFIVLKHTTVTPSEEKIFFGIRNNGDGLRRIRTSISTTGAQSLNSQRLDTGTESSLAISASGADTSWHVMSYITDWTNREIRMYTDGILDGTLNPIADAAGSTPNTNGSRYRIGCSTLNTVSNFWAGKIAEIVIIPSDVTLNTRQKLEGYLHHKYGLQGNLPLDHQYKGQPPYLVSST